MKRRLDPAMTCSLAIVLTWLVVTPDQPVTAQSQTVSVAIANFQDDSGSNMSPDLRLKLAQDLQQKLAVAYTDILPRMIASGVDAAAGNAPTVEQLSALGKQNGARFVVRGGLLAAIPEPMVEKSGITVQLYAEVISVETGSVVTTVRGAGKATQRDPVEALSAVDPKSDQYRNSAVGLASAGAIAQLADAIHQAVTAPVTVAVAQPAVTQPTEAVNQAAADVNAPQTEAANVAEADTELQQLIGQAESILSAGGNASTQSITAVRQSLEALQSALATKARLMEGGQDFTQADQDIATGKQALQTAVAQVTAELSAPQATSPAAVEQPTAERKGLLASVDEAASQALSILQKIQQIRTTLREADASAASGATDPTSSATAPPTEQPVSEASGVVVDGSGNPVEGAQVTDQESGATTTTDSSGVYHLQGLLTDRMANLLVRKNQISTSALVEVLRGRPAVVDFHLKPPSAATKISTVGVLPSTVLLSSLNNRVATSGTVAGVVQDAQGRPVPRALVNLQGLGVARTNSQGQYAFLNVPAGAHEVVITQSGLKPRAAQVQVVAQQRNETKTQFSANDRISSVVNRTALILPSSTTLVKGTVVDQENHPIAGTRVSAVQERGAVTVVTGARGAFELRGLTPGSYRIVVSKVGYEGTSNNVNLRSSGTEERGFQLRKQSSPLVASVLSKDLARRVAIRGRVRASNGSPVPNATVELKSAGTSLPIASTTTNAGGEYSFNVREGRYEIRVRQTSYQEVSRTMNVTGGSSAQADFSLQVLAPQPLITSGRVPSGKGQIFGRITDARTGRPISGAGVTIEGFSPIRTDQQGNYALANVAAGDYQARVTIAGYAEESKRISVRAGASSREDFALKTQTQQQTTIPRTGAQIDTRVLTRPGGISGQVIDAKTRRPIAGVTISIAGQRSVSSDSAGRLVVANLSPGTYQVSAAKAGYSSDQRTVVVRSGETATLSFSLTPRTAVPR